MWKYCEELAEEIRLGSLSTRLEQGLGTPPLTMYLTSNGNAATAICKVTVECRMHTARVQQVMTSSNLKWNLALDSAARGRRAAPGLSEEI